MSAEPRPLRRVVTGALAVALPLGLLLFSLVTFLQASETEAIADRQEATVSALETRAARLSERAGAQLDATAVYLPGDGVEIARAELQKLLSDAVSEAGGRLIETQEPGNVRDADAPDDGRVELRVTFDVGNDGLLDLLYGLETRLPLLTIERLEARRLDAEAEASDDDPMLRVSFVARGHRKLPA